MKKKWFLIGCLLVSTSAFARNIPAHYNQFGALVPDSPGTVSSSSSSNNTQSAEQEAMVASQPSGILPNVVISSNNQLYINGDRVALSPTQRSFVEGYGNTVRTYKPKVESFINSGLDTTKSVFGSLSDSVTDFLHQNHLDTTFTKCKTQVTKYIKDGELVFPVDVFNNKQTLDNQISQKVSTVSAQSDAMFDQMNQQIQKNQQMLNSMKKQITALQSQLNTMDKHSHQAKTLAKQASQMQQDLIQLSSQQQQLQTALTNTLNQKNHSDIVIESAPNTANV